MKLITIQNHNDNSTRDERDTLAVMWGDPEDKILNLEWPLQAIIYVRHLEEGYRFIYEEIEEQHEETGNPTLGSALARISNGGALPPFTQLPNYLQEAIFAARAFEEPTDIWTLTKLAEQVQPSISANCPTETPTPQM